jgi:hypothetical protein
MAHFVWARRALNSPKRRFPAPRATACLVHYLLLQKVTSRRSTLLKVPGPGGQWMEKPLAPDLTGVTAMPKDHQVLAGRECPFPPRRESCRGGPNVASWPKILTANPY